MFKKLLYPAILVVLISSSPVTAQDTGGEGLGWDEGRASIMNDSLHELVEYEPFKSFPPEKLKLFASCLVEKRIQIGKKVGCGWSADPGVSPQQYFADQYKCFEDGGYGKAGRIEHSAFCSALIEQYF